MQSAQDAKLSLERMDEIHQMENEEKEVSNNEKAKYLTNIPKNKDIIIRNLSFRYDFYSDDVLKDVNATIPENKITAIVGASGSGKTTLLKLILGFYRPREGEINIGNNDLNELKPSFWRANCGVVMQDGYIFSDTIEKNISLSEPLIDTEKLEQSAQTACISDYIHELPIGYQTQIGQEGVGLSQGQKQRMLIARVVYKNPHYIFFDEATNALDANNEKAIMKNLDAFFKNKTVVIVAHRLSTVKKADQIIVLDKGKIIEQGNHQTLTAQKGAYYQLVKNQLELGR